MKDLGVVPSRSGCPDGSAAGVGDDVNRATVFLAKENMDDRLSFFAGPPVPSAPLSSAAHLRSIEPLSISEDLDTAPPKPAEKLNRKSVTADVRKSLGAPSDSERFTFVVGMSDGISDDCSLASSPDGLGGLETATSFVPEPGNWSADIAAPRTGQFDHCDDGLSNSTIFLITFFDELPGVGALLELDGVKTSKVPAASGAWLGETKLRRFPPEAGVGGTTPGDESPGVTLAPGDCHGNR